MPVWCSHHNPSPVMFQKRQILPGFILDWQLVPDFEVKTSTAVCLDSSKGARLEEALTDNSLTQHRLVRNVSSCNAVPLLWACAVFSPSLQGSRLPGNLALSDLFCLCACSESHWPQRQGPSYHWCSRCNAPGPRGEGVQSAMQQLLLSIS